MNAPDTERVNWWAVAVFFGVACAISWPLYWWRDMHRAAFDAFPGPSILKNIFIGWGPGLSGLLCRRLFRRTHRATVTWSGGSWGRTALLVGAPIALLTAWGVPPAFGLAEPRLMGFLTAVGFVVYAIGEETGWRGFLQDALRPLPERLRWPLLGTLWFIWHFTNFVQGSLSATLREFAIILVLLVIASWGIGRVVERTHALAFAVVLHLVFNFLQLPSPLGFVAWPSSWWREPPCCRAGQPRPTRRAVRHARWARVERGGAGWASGSIPASRLNAEAPAAPSPAASECQAGHPRRAPGR